MAAVSDVRVSTLHSLGLSALRAAGMLSYFPTDPMVLDQWESENIFDSEFGRIVVGSNPSRPKAIREQHEAFWSTDAWNPPNYAPPDPPITRDERDKFQAFHGPRTQIYSCVLPGEIVRRCVEQMRANVLDPVQTLNIRHLIVDEFQDLNPMDIEFVDLLSKSGATTFVVGDDDQCLYAFRFARPQGFQEYPVVHDQCGQHKLIHCFRCPPTILETARGLIQHYAGDQSIKKEMKSLHATATPPHPGFTLRWQFKSGVAEARAIAESCKSLIEHGVKPSEIFILVQSTDSVSALFKAEFAKASIPFEASGADKILDNSIIRFVRAIARIIINSDDYIAHRVVLGSKSRVGPSTTHEIALISHINNLNYRNLFYEPLPQISLSKNATQALQASRDICYLISQWSPESSVSEHFEEISELIKDHMNPKSLDVWIEAYELLPGGINFKEMKDYFRASSDDEIQSLRETINARTSEVSSASSKESEPQTSLTERVRLMTMHGSKGLDASVVFIPALEEELFPGPRRKKFSGLVSEAARMLYVAITRSKTTCIMSFARQRVLFGGSATQTPSQFVSRLGGAFFERGAGLSAGETQAIANGVIMERRN